MNPSKDCFKIIKKWEGLHRLRSDGSIEAYQDPVGIWTIGYGSTQHGDLARPIQPGDKITSETAMRWLVADVEEVAEDVQHLCKAALTQSMFDALVSFVYNIGIGAFGESTLLRKINQQDYEGAAREFDRWVHGSDGGTRRVLPGLVNRRNEEEDLFRKDGFKVTRVTASEQTAHEGLADKAEALPYKPAPLPLAFSRPILVKGNIGEDCFILNCALAGLGFLRMEPQTNEFSELTYQAVLLLQRKEALSKVDGIVGPETKRAIEKALQRARNIIPDLTSTQSNYCRLTRLHETAYAGLNWCKLEFINPTNGDEDFVRVITGAPGAQLFLLPSDPRSVPGSGQPIPQGRYRISDIDWAGGRDNYTESHKSQGNALGPVWVPLTGLHRDDRGAFGIHADWNWIQSNQNPGSDGCVCPTTMEDLKNIVKLLRAYDPRLLIVDWS